MEAADEAVICRMPPGSLKVACVHDSEAIADFGNRRYAAGIEAAVTSTLDAGADPQTPVACVKFEHS